MHSLLSDRGNFGSCDARILSGYAHVQAAAWDVKKLRAHARAGTSGVTNGAKLIYSHLT